MVNKLLGFFGLKLTATRSDAEAIEKRISSYLKNGKVPWTQGYAEFKHKVINEMISSPGVISMFKRKVMPEKFGIGIDERIVEYPWLFSRLADEKKTLLDAGSTFNFDFIVNHAVIKKKALTIFTFYPEPTCFYKERISYVFGDLRQMYFSDNTFDEIISHSTIEHIDMDNSIYGYNEGRARKGKSFEYLKAVKEMIRTLKPSGRLLLTFPFGKYEDHGFFQQFDVEMLQRILDLFLTTGSFELDYFKYEKSGWRFAEGSELSEVESYNPHTGKGKGDDGAAHCRSIACIEFVKKIG